MSRTMTRRQMLDRVREFMSDDDLVRAIGPGFYWDFSKIGEDGWERAVRLDAVAGPADFCWIWSGRLVNKSSCFTALPSSWDVDPTEWRLSKV